MRTGGSRPPDRGPVPKPPVRAAEAAAIAIRSIISGGTLFEVVHGFGGVSSEHAPDPDAEAVEGGDAVVASPFGFDIVIEEEFIEFPWRAGMKRAVVALAATYVLVTAIAAASGVSDGPVVGTLVYLGLVVYGLHNIPVAPGEVPGVLEPVAERVVEYPLLRGFVLTGPEHGDPVGHVLAIASGQSESIGHIEALPADPTVPIAVYAAVPMVVLVATGFEFALRYWDEVTVDSVVEVGRFGAAVGAGYVLVLFVGTFFLTSVGLTGVVMPDRYVTLVFGFVYPAVFATVGALLVYAQQEWPGE